MPLSSCGRAGLLLAVLIVPPTARAEDLTFDVQFRDAILAESNAGLSLGDRFILNDLLLRDGVEAGTASGLCTITDTLGIALCIVTFSLADGTISTQFVNAPPPEKVFAILGGTGRFQNARGIGELVEFGDQTGRLTFHLAD